MKHLIFFLTFYSFCSAQNKIVFSYDTAGNQIKREICINCPAGTGRLKDEDLAEKDIEAKDFMKSDDLEGISYYPNPVKEELYVRWPLEDNKYITTISVYNINGQKLKNFTEQKNTITETIRFSEYPQGIYTILLDYNNGEQKTLKIIKK